MSIDITMITIFLRDCNSISQSFYDSVINRIQLHQLCCTCGHSACMSMHKNHLLLIQVENCFDGEVRIKNNTFVSSKRKGNGVGIQSVRHISEKNGGANTFTYENGVFIAKVMLHGW